MKTTEDSLEKNYRNFAIAIVLIIVVFIGLGILIDYFEGFLPKTDPEFSSGYAAGVKIGRMLRWYIDGGLWLGNIFAFIAAMEKKIPFGKGILLTLLGWVYVCYYALTRKTVVVNQTLNQ